MDRRQIHPAWLLLCTLPSLLFACSSPQLGDNAQPVIQLSPAPTPIAWNEYDDTHRRIVARFDRLIAGAHPIESPEALAASVDLTPPVVILVGESHATPAPARAFARALWNRPDAPGVELWEEGDQWTFGDVEPMVRGFVSGAWQIDNIERRPLVSGGPLFNHVVGERLASGEPLPARLLVHAGHSHVHYDPDLPTGHPPAPGAPAPCEAFKSLAASGGAGPRVESYRVYTHSSFVMSADVMLTQAILLLYEQGKLTRVQALEAANWAIERVRQIVEACRAMGNFVTDESASAHVVVINTGEPRLALTATAALGYLLTKPEVAEMLDDGWRPRLYAITLPESANPSPESTFNFLLMPPAHVKGNPRLWKIGWRAWGWTAGSADYTEEED